MMVGRLQEERELVPYTTEGVMPADRVLVVAPHPDDEVFGCGGCMRLHTKAGVPVEVVVLTDGGGAGDPQVRAEESRAGCAALGVPPPQWWGYPDRGLWRDPGLINELALRIGAAINSPGNVLVYGPSPWEVHPDHRAAARVLAQAVHHARRAGIRVVWAAYEVGAPLWPHRLVNIDAVWTDKQSAMRCYPSQLAFQPYDRHIEALNRYRSYTVSGQCQHAEALWVPNDQAMLEIISDWDIGYRHPSSLRGLTRD